MTAAVTKPLVVASITCYHDPAYIRTRTLNTALESMADVDVVTVVNRSRGMRRYLEVAVALVRTARRNRPDLYLLNFRGYELLPLVLAVAGRRPVVFDEFVNPMLVVREHGRNKTGLLGWAMGHADRLAWPYHRLLRRTALVLTDTDAHARYSQARSGLPLAHYVPVPVGAEESVFSAPVAPRPTPPSGPVRVFFYSTGSQPLHGLDVILDAAVQLADRSDIRFVVAGTKGDIAGQVERARTRGAHIDHHAWIPFDELAATIHDADICLGGPFGGTEQAMLVVTGKTYQFLACGAATVVGHNAATETFHDRDDSLVVPQSDPDALAAAIAWAADHPDERDAIGREGRRLYERRFGARAVADALRAGLEPIMDSARRPLPDG